VSANRPVPVDRLADDLWNGSPPAHARSTLQSHISILRGLLGAQRLEHRHGGYQLRVHEHELDASRFERLTSEGRARLSAGLAGEGRELFRQALACWRGPALVDVAESGWAQGEARRLEEQRAAVLELWLEAGLAVGDHRDVVALAEMAVVDHPYRERLWAFLMLALYRSGRQSEALTAYQRLRILLAEELGLEPSRALADLERAILSHDPSLEVSARAVAEDPSSTDGGSAIVTKALLFTDVVERAYLWDQVPEQMMVAIRSLGQITAASVARHHGRIVRNMGDGAYASFDDVADGVSAAVEIQQQLQGRQWPGVGSIGVRMGLNAGTCHVFRDDVYGPTVNLAAQLHSIANGGQILISEATALECRHRLPPQVTTLYLGPHRLRGVEEPVIVHMVVADGLSADFPPLRAALTGFDELPAEATPLIGRDDLVAHVATTVTTHAVTTLWGPGGCGKTRVAVRVARQARRPFVDGIRFADLASVRTGEQVLDSIMTLLHAQPLEREEPTSTILRVLRPLRMLLVLDSVEHVRAPAARMVREIQRSCPWVHVLATSREALGVRGERRVSVPPLTVPGEHSNDPGYIAQFESAQMFVERARDVVSGFELDSETAPAVARLCRAVEGLPLGLELGAARLDVDSISELSSAGDNLVQHLERYDSAERADSLGGSLEWSLQQLSLGENELFELLAAFCGPFSREQAREMAGRPDTVDRDLDHLLRCALVSRDPETMRFRLPVTSRQYAHARHGEAAWPAIRERHARLMLGRAVELGAAFLGPDQQATRRSLREEFADHREAMQWFLGREMVDEGAELLVALFQFAFNQFLTEVHGWARQMERLIPDGHPLAAEVCGAAALAAWSSGETEVAVAHGERAITNAGLQVGSSTVWARTALQNAWGYVGRMDKVAPHYLALTEELSRSPEPYWQTLGLGFQAISNWMAGRRDRAEERAARAVALARRLGNPECIHWALYCRGRILEPTDPDAASAAFEEAIDAARSVDSGFYLSLDLLEWAGLKRRLGQRSVAAVALLELLDLLHTSGNSSQLSQMYLEIAHLLADEGDGASGAVVFLGRVGLPQMPKGRHEAEPDSALAERLRVLTAEQWSSYESRAVAMTHDTLMHFARSRLEHTLDAVEGPRAAR
jgi:predicted ATPase/class 3 adenylate cyclase